MSAAFGTERANTGQVSDASLVFAYVATMLLSASMLFLVQPMFARMALPLLGGTPSVWAIAMCFFQGALLAGYAYAHLLRKFVSLRFAIVLHVCLMVSALTVLPVSVTSQHVSNDSVMAGLGLVWIMAKSIGFPFFLLSATAPLLQSWFAQTTHKDSANPYFLYSASNIGSLCSLVAYPFVIEPFFGIAFQSTAWAMAFCLLIAAIGFCGALMLRKQKSELSSTTLAALTHTPLRQKLMWVFLAFVPSALLVAWTNRITTDIASAPFLWLPPLVLFLLTFVLVFRDKPAVSMKWAALLQIISFPLVFGVDFVLPVHLAIATLLIGAVSFFTTALLCHRQLYDQRPDASNLTEFYMLMSLGGVLGGLFVSLVAPVVFSSVLEYPILLLLGLCAQPGLMQDEKLRAFLRNPLVPVVVLVAAALYFRFGASYSFGDNFSVAKALQLGVLTAAAVALFKTKHVNLACAALAAMIPIQVGNAPEPRFVVRNYFGVTSVFDFPGETSFRVMSHGTTSHGAQFLAETAPSFTGRPTPLMYYGNTGGIGRALLATQSRMAAKGMHGVYRIIGLGIGVMACYAKPGEDWAYYEIDPDVVKLAKDPSLFTYMSSCSGGAPVHEGDARITLAAQADMKSDYLLVDAFSADSIPIHLITTDALSLYFSRLQDDGVLVFHISNRYLNLAPVLAANLRAVEPSAQALFIKTKAKKNAEQNDFEVSASEVVVISRNANSLASLARSEGASPLVVEEGVAAWTDDFYSLPSAIYRRLSGVGQ